MATKLYLHNASNALAGTFPTTEQSSTSASWTATGATTLKTMDTTIGVSQSSVSGSTLAQTAAQNGWLGFFCSKALSGSQTVGGGTLTLSAAFAQSNANVNLGGPIASGLGTFVEIYVWRPSTGAKVGTVASIKLFSGTEPSSTNTEKVVNGAKTATSSAVNASDGDVVICEIWTAHAQGMATSYTVTYYYDGTTENDVEGTTVSSHAGYIQFNENLVFYGPKEVSPGTGSITLTGYAPTVSVGANQNVSPGTGAITLTGYAPTVQTPRNVSPGTGAIVIDGYAPTVSVTNNLTVSPGTGVIDITGYAPTVETPRNVSPGTGEITLEGYAPTVSVTENVSVSPGAGEIVILGYAPTVNIGVVASPGTGAIDLVGYEPTVSVTNNVVVSPGLGEIVITGYAPTVTGGSTPEPPTSITTDSISYPGGTSSPFRKDDEWRIQQEQKAAIQREDIELLDYAEIFMKCL